MMKTDLAVFTTLCLAFCLSVTPLPDWAMLARPELPIMVLAYWIMAMPERYGVWSALWVGIFQDGLAGTYIGVHALTYAIAAAVIIMSHQQLRMYGAWKQALAIGFLLCFIQWLELFLNSMLMPMQYSLAHVLLPAVSAILVWPWLMLILRDLRRRIGFINRFT